MFLKLVAKSKKIENIYFFFMEICCVQESVWVCPQISRQLKGTVVCSENNIDHISHSLVRMVGTESVVSTFRWIG